MSSVAAGVRALMVLGFLSSDLRWGDRSLRDSLRLDTRSWCYRSSLAVDCCRSSSSVTVRSLRAVSANVTGLATPVAGLACRVRLAAVGRRAVARDVAELAAGIALHGLSLAITGEMVRTAALVAGCCAVGRDTREAAPESAPRGSTSTTACWCWGSSSRVRAATSKMARLTARVAASARRTAAQA